MKELIKHFLDNNTAEVVEKSLFNCHVRGLHSIMLLDSPGKRIRLYITEKEHDLTTFKNLAFHPHHCDLTLVCIKGSVHNRNLILSEDGFALAQDAKLEKKRTIKKFLYSSHISNGHLGFKEVGEALIVNHKNDYLESMFANIGKSSIFLKADVIHSVECPLGQYNAWLVFEGEEDANYIPYCYSFQNPIVGENLYDKVSIEQIKDLLIKSKII